MEDSSRRHNEMEFVSLTKKSGQNATLGAYTGRIEGYYNVLQNRSYYPQGDSHRALRPPGLLGVF